MKKVFLSIFSLFITVAAIAQDGPKNLADSLKLGFWDKRSTQLSIDLSAASFNDAWITNKGGTRNTAIGLLFKNKAVYHKNKGIWSNDMKFQFGSMKTKDQGGEFRKNLDLIFIDSKYARVITKQLNWFLGANFISQLAPDYEYNKTTFKRGKKLSALFAPGYLSEGFGVEWKPKPFFTVQFGGATLKQTFVSNDEVFTNRLDTKTNKAFGVAKGKNMLNEMGFQVVIDFNKEIVKNVSLAARYQGFKAFSPSGKSLDHFISADITGKINKYMGVRASFIGIKDEDVTTDFLTNLGAGVGLVFTL